MRGHVLPIVQLILLPVCWIVTYVWSVLLGHVEAGFPYISDTGTFPPESCVFGLLLDLYASVTAVIVYLRWQQVRTYHSAEESRLCSANNVSLVLGLIAAFGILLVSNFQETNVQVVHLIGAFLAFFVGSVYTCIQTYVSYTTHLPGHHRCLRHVRLGIAITVIICCILVVVCAWVASSKLEDSDPKEKHHKWSPSDKGFAEHLISTIFEWIMGLLSAIFFATFTLEFRNFTFSMPIEFTVVISEIKDETEANGRPTADTVDDAESNLGKDDSGSTAFTMSETIEE